MALVAVRNSRPPAKDSGTGQARSEPHRTRAIENFERQIAAETAFVDRLQAGLGRGPSSVTNRTTLHTGPGGPLENGGTIFQRFQNTYDCKRRRHG